MNNPNTAAQTATPDPKKAAGLAKFLQDEAEVIWALASNEKDKMHARRLLDASYIVAAYPSALAQLRQAREELERNAVILDDAANYFSMRNLEEPARLLMGRLITAGANTRARLTTTAPKEKP